MGMYEHFCYIKCIHTYQQCLNQCTSIHICPCYFHVSLIHYVVHVYSKHVSMDIYRTTIKEKVSPHDTYPFISSFSTWEHISEKTSSDQRMSSHQGVPWWQVILYRFISSMNRLTKFGITHYNVPNIIHLSPWTTGNNLLLIMCMLGIHIQVELHCTNIILTFMNLLIIYWYYMGKIYSCRIPLNTVIMSYVC